MGKTKAKMVGFERPREMSLGERIQRSIDKANKRQQDSIKAMEAFKKRTGQQGQDIIRLM